VLRLIAALAGAALLAACGPLPRPFETDDKSANPLLRLADEGGVVVPPAVGLADGPARALAEALAAALRELDVPANVRAGNPQSLILDLQYDEVGGRGRVAASLVDPQGKVVGDPRAEAPRPARPDDPESWAAFARPVAKALVDAMKPDAVVPTELPALVVGTVAGAPGDGGRALARSLAFHLQRAGARVVDAAGPDVLAVAGEVTLADVSAETKRVAVRWLVRDAAGAELGRVDMQNPVPARMVDRQWSELAYDIAGASVDGILDIAERFRIRPR
jgi:hypothetical protein